MPLRSVTPDFSPVDPQEIDELEMHISILSVPEPMLVTSEEDLLYQLRPGVDGLLLEDKDKRGTFLPSVWESLPTPSEFVAQLKRKSGLSEDYWSNTISFQRYTTEEFGYSE